MKTIEFPNGVRMEGVPDDATEEDILRELKRTDPETFKIALNSLAKKGAASPGLSGSVPIRIPGTDIGVNASVPEGVEAAMLGGGRSLSRLAAGVESFFSDEDERIDAEQAEEAAAFAPIQQSNPVASTIGEALPAFAIPMGAVGKAVGTGVKALGASRAGTALAASPVADAALTGGLLGALDHDGSAAIGAAGGLTGGLLGKGIAATMRPVMNRATGSQSRAADVATRRGYTVTPSQATDSPGLTRLETSLRSNPFSSGAFRAADEGNQATINRLAAEGIGESAEAVTDEVLDRAANRIGGVFQKIGKGAGDVPVDNTLLSKVIGAQDDYYDALPEADKLLRMFNAGSIKGPDLLAESSKLGKRARSLMRSQPDRGMAVFELKDALDDALMRKVGGDAKRELATARRQWKNLLHLTEAGVVKDPTRGDVSAATLGNVLRRKDKLGFMRGRGRGPIEDAARIGKAFPTPPDSWTASRLAVPMAAMGGGGLLAGQQMAEGDLGTGLALLAAPAAAMALGGRAYMSAPVRRYLEKGVPLLGQPGPRQAIGGLLGQSGASMGLLSAQ